MNSTEKKKPKPETKYQNMAETKEHDRVVIESWTCVCYRRTEQEIALGGDFMKKKMEASL